MRSMNTMPTYRKGRRVYRKGSSERGGIGGICSILFLSLIFAFIPCLFIFSEWHRRERFVALYSVYNGNNNCNLDKEKMTKISKENVKQNGIETDATCSDNNQMIELNKSNNKNNTSHSKSSSTLTEGSVVHGISTNIPKASVYDPDMSLELKNALTLERKTEYCQWREIRTEECQTCTRSVKAKDGSSEEETYSCNCITKYDYVKAWTNHPISSFLFDQPAAHHNPQRDPVPSRTFVSQDLVVEFGPLKSEELLEKEQDKQFLPSSSSYSSTSSTSSWLAKIHPSMITQSLVRGAQSRKVDWTQDGSNYVRPSKLSSFFQRYLPYLHYLFHTPTRYEKVSSLLDNNYHQDDNHSQNPNDINVGKEHGFVYVGNGYFFSPYQSTLKSNLFNYFFQYLEGTLFDFQFGDIVPSCTPGDIRLTYKVRDPSTISVLGQSTLIHNNQNLNEKKTLTIKPIDVTSTIGTVGLVHEGRVDAQTMLLREDNDSWIRAILPRILLMIWSIPISRLLTIIISQRMLSQSRWFPTQIAAMISVACGITGITWCFLWGIRASLSNCVDSIFLCLLSMATMGFLFIHPPPMASSRCNSGLWAGWCMFAKWANVPPHWRMVDSYALNLYDENDHVDDSVDVKNEEKTKMS